jgi:hypothetical protein
MWRIPFLIYCVACWEYFLFRIAAKCHKRTFALRGRFLIRPGDFNAG